MRSTMFEELTSGSVRLLDHPAEIRLPEDFASAESRNIRFSAAFYRVEFGQCRSVYIASNKIEIFNLFFFPVDGIRGPIYAMEFVRMGKKMVVAVIDVAGNPRLAESREIAKQIIAPHREYNHHLPQGKDPPQWYQECRSGYDFFVRPEGPEQMEELIRLHYRIFKNYLEAIAPLQKALSPDGEIPQEFWQQSYKNHHADNSPGLPFLNRTFGEEWTQRLLREHLFG